MDSLSRYLQAVRFWLPAKHQDDIIAELGEDLRSQVEDRESRLGRSLTVGDWRILLKERGNPLLVANSYQGQRYLIGPMLFPVYWVTLKIVLLCASVPSLLGLVGRFILVPADRAPMGHAWFPALWACVYWPAVFTFLPLTLAFAALERYQPAWLFDWSPSKLLPVRDARRIPRSTSLFELAVTGVFFLGR